MSHLIINLSNVPHEQLLDAHRVLTDAGYQQPSLMMDLCRDLRGEIESRFQKVGEVVRGLKALSIPHPQALINLYVGLACEKKKYPLESNGDALKSQ